MQTFNCDSPELTSRTQRKLYTTKRQTNPKKTLQNKVFYHDLEKKQNCAQRVENP